MTPHEEQSKEDKPEDRGGRSLASLVPVHLPGNVAFKYYRTVPAWGGGVPSCWNVTVLPGRSKTQSKEY